MRPGRRAVRGVIAASVVAAAVGHAAATRATDERGVREHRFTLVLRGSMVTTWTLPRAPFQDSTITDPRSGETCVRWWVGGEGRQEVTFGVRAPVRMGSGSTLPTPTGFKKIPWRAERHGTMLIETQPLRSCGGEYRQPIGGAEGDCGTREILGYIGFGPAKIAGGFWDNDFSYLFKDCPLLPGLVRSPATGALDWFAEEPDHLVFDSYNEGALPATRGKLPSRSAFLDCGKKRLLGHYEGSETRRGIVDAQSGDKVPAEGLARWTSTTVVSVDVTYTRVGACPRR